MSETVKICPLCGHPKNDVFDQRDFRGYAVANRICSNCGLVFQSPHMSAAELEKFYETEYTNLYQGEDSPTQKNIKIQRGRAAALLSFINEWVKDVSSHLDIGSSTGELLLEFQDVLGTQPVGVEPGESYRRHAQSRELKVYPSLKELKRENAERFSLVTMLHVLEHLMDPVSYLRDLREEILAPDGWLLLEVPNLYSHESFEIAHLFAFSPRTIREVLLQAGFEVIAIKKHGAPRSLILPLYLTLLARPASNEQPPPLRLEKGVALKRRLGMFRFRVLSRLFPHLAWIPPTT